MMPYWNELPRTEWEDIAQKLYHTDPLALLQHYDTFKRNFAELKKISQHQLHPETPIKSEEKKNSPPPNYVCHKCMVSKVLCNCKAKQMKKTKSYCRQCLFF
jgi:hypothetical protein